MESNYNFFTLIFSSALSGKTYLYRKKFLRRHDKRGRERKKGNVYCVLSFDFGFGFFS